MIIFELQSGVPETIKKTGSIPKSHKSRTNLFKKYENI